MSSLPKASAALLELVSRANDTNNGTTLDPNPETQTRPPIYKIIGIILAITSGLFIGVSFVIKKVGLLKANVKYNEEAGEGYGYLKNAWWWLGMSLMIVGEICNFAAYAFVDAILVTPMGSLSVVVSTILSAIFLKERLSFVGKVGCFNCIVGSVVIALNAPKDSAVGTIQEMQHFVIAPGFLSYAGVIVIGCIVIALWAGPRYGKRSMFVYLSICSLIGGLSVTATQGIGAAILAQAAGTPQFNQWFIYVLLVFVIATLLTEIIYLNKALNIFNASLVTPTYYVFFTSATIVTSAILFRGFKGTPIQITTIVLGFLQICSGVVLLQLSKSAKDVPDTAVLKGDLDQIRTVAEQEEHESEPKADAIRGAAVLVRSFSKSRQKKEAAEAKRIQEDLLEPIGENEIVEWDGLRRRKTILAPGQSPIRRQKTIHPPLGLTHFPDDISESSHNPEDDYGMLPNLRRRTAGMFSHGAQVISSISGSDVKDSNAVQIVPMSTISSAEASSRADLTTSNTYELPPDLQRSTTIGLSKLKTQDTHYRSPASTATDGPPKSRLDPPPRTHKPGPPTPSQGNRRQFSFPTLFNKEELNDTRAASSTSTQHRSIGGRVLAGLRRPSLHGTRTEEERLGLVQGEDRSMLPPRGRSRESYVADDNDSAFEESPERISRPSSSTSDDKSNRSYARVNLVPEDERETRQKFADDNMDARDAFI